MKKAQLKSALNQEFKNEGIIRTIKKVRDINGQTVFEFKDGMDMKTLKYLNNRFSNGISINEEDNSLVYVNTPNQTKVEI